MSALQEVAERPAAPARVMPTMRVILAEVAAKYAIDPEVIRLSRTRARHVTWPRQEFMWRAREVRWANGAHRYHLSMIGNFLGGMDHATVLHGVRRHAERVAELSPLSTSSTGGVESCEPWSVGPANASPAIVFS